MSADNKQIISIKPLHFSQKISPEQLFATMADTPWAMWLDSCNSNHIDSRYDIIVWQPEITLTTRDKTTSITLADDQRQDSEDDPLELLAKYQNSLFANYTLTQNNVPFIGGAVGYFSYDLGRRFERLPKTAEQDIDLPEMAVGIYSQALIFDKNTEQWLLICPENTRAAIETDLSSSLLAKQEERKQHFTLTSKWQANISKAAYQNKFDRIQEHLLAGDCYQINLTQRFDAQYQGNEFVAYQALRRENKAPFSAFLRFQQHAILSISPERFLQLKGNKVQSKPIKGTMPRNINGQVDRANAEVLRQSTKDRAENLMIVDLLRNDLSKVCQPGTVKVPILFDIESFPAVHHLVSTVEGELSSEFSANDVLRSAFPGGSITGAPKIRAMEIIESLEPQRRSIYCGSIGYISACGNMDTSITIRTLVCERQTEQNTIYCWAGGGIVFDSNVASEYQESFDKVNKILPVLEKL